jgi:maltose alpha-D-glucosyltransferase/alpha-amylase
VLSRGLAGLLSGEDNARLQEVLPSYLVNQRWFGSKAHHITAVRLGESIPVPHGLGTTHVTLADVSYSDAQPERYLLPLAVARGELAEQIWDRAPWAVVARMSEPRGAILIDALADPGFSQALLEAISHRRRYRGQNSDLLALPASILRHLRDVTSDDLAPRLSRSEQSNNSVVFGERLILKVYRRLEDGVNPDLEVGRFLTEKTDFRNIAPVAGSILLRRSASSTAVVGMLQQYVPNQGDAWSHVLQVLDVLFGAAPSADPMGGFGDEARLLGRRTAELHLALASDPDDPAFAPEPSTMLDARSIYQSARTLHGQVMQLLAREARELHAPLRPLADQLLECQQVLLERLRGILDAPLSARRIRVHGDYHLGQVLWTGNDFVIIDFEGEPARPLSERRLKRWSLKDVAGMIRSFDYAAESAARSAGRGTEKTARLWSAATSDAYLDAYTQVAGQAVFMPRTPQETRLLLDAMLIEKALYELRYELNSRPDWVGIPLRGLLRLADATEEAVP